MFVEVIMEIDAAPEEAWPFLADWGGGRKIFSLCTHCESEGEGLGATRVIRVDDAQIDDISGDANLDLGRQEIRETVVAFDPVHLALSYAVEEPSPLPVTDYVATVKMDRLDGGRTQISWSSRSNPKGSALEARPLFEGAYREGILGIERCVLAARASQV